MLAILNDLTVLINCQTRSANQFWRIRKLSIPSDWITICTCLLFLLLVLRLCVFLLIFIFIILGTIVSKALPRVATYMSPFEWCGVCVGHDKGPRVSQISRNEIIQPTFYNQMWWWRMGRSRSFLFPQSRPTIMRNQLVIEPALHRYRHQSWQLLLIQFPWFWYIQRNYLNSHPQTLSHNKWVDQCSALPTLSLQIYQP